MEFPVTEAVTRCTFKIHHRLRVYDPAAAEGGLEREGEREREREREKRDYGRC
jgi:hypothetical protein